MKTRFWGIDPVTQTAARSAALQKSTLFATYTVGRETHVVMTNRGQSLTLKTITLLAAITFTFNIVRFVHDCVWTWSSSGTCANRIDWTEIKRREAAVRSISDGVILADHITQPEPIVSSNNWASTMIAVNLRVAPDRSAEIRTVLQEGARIEILSTVPGWAEVQTVKAQYKGWITQSAIGLDSDSSIPDDRITSKNSPADPVGTGNVTLEHRPSILHSQDTISEKVTE